MILQNGRPCLSHGEVTLFAFDDHALPFQNGVELRLISHNHGDKDGRAQIVVGLGEENAPDSRQVIYYGSVQRVGDELWMWYLGQGTEAKRFERICFAKSRDGIHWEKPKLGLVEYKGNTQNNLIDLNQGSHHIQACVVLYEADEPDPQRRFKMAFESDQYESVFAVAYSADGLRWHESPNNPVGQRFEMAGAARFNGCYYLCGQWGNQAGALRQLVTHVSYDFEHWVEAACVGLRRGFSAHQLRPPGDHGGDHTGEQVHLGAALWNRGNVLIGFYGMWHGHASNDRRLLTMDLGLALTTDGLHYWEPIPDFPIVAAGNGKRALMQGQGFANVGDQTLFWYAPWPEAESDGVRVAIWARDRLGYFHAFQGRSMRSIQEAHFVSAPVDLEGRGAQLFLNVDGISAQSGVNVEIVDEKFNKIAEYGAEECIAPTVGGFEQSVRWQGQESIRHSDGSIRLRVNFTGQRPEEVRLFALYLREVS